MNNLNVTGSLYLVASFVGHRWELFTVQFSSLELAHQYAQGRLEEHKAKRCLVLKIECETKL